MAEKYITLAEAAELEEMDYHTLVVRMQRENNYKTITEPDEENGGRERVLVALSSLSKKARNLYKERQNVDIGKLTEDEPGAPWYRKRDVR